MIKNYLNKQLQQQIRHGRTTFDKCIKENSQHNPDILNEL